MTAPVSRRLLIVCFGASGAAALIYQVAWVRLLTLALGHTVAAASTVLAAFMGGLALGAWGAGRTTAARISPLTTYAALEMVIAAAAIALPHLLHAVDPMLVAAYADGTTPATFAIARITVSVFLVGIPATAMGATYPLAVAWLSALEAKAANDVRPSAAAAGVLYGANATGAAAGAVAAGFWLIESFGIRGTTWIAVAMNVAAAGMALSISRARPTPKTVVRSDKRRGRNPQPAAIAPRPGVATVAAALSGSAALVYEVAWTRLIALTLGPTTYAFATMAASFIAGIAIGSTVGVRLARRSARVVSRLGVMLVATALSTMLAASFTASHLPFVIARDVAAHSEFDWLLLRQTLTIAVVLLPPSATLGATFTLALAAAGAAADAAARRTATVYTANTVGAVAGALAAGFLLVPWLGLQHTFLYTSGALLVAGSVITTFAQRWANERQSHWLAALALFAGSLIVVIAVGAGGWDRDVVTSGAYKYARQMAVEDLESGLRAGHLEYYREGPAGTISVRRLAGSRSLAIDGKVDASNGGDMLTQRMLGLLPTLLHPKPLDALVIGLGSGVTADAALASGDVRNLDILEISPEVAEASAFFEAENHNVLTRPGVRLLIGDGRSHLRLADRPYDVIISEPSNPWMAGVAALFTREFFESARARLTAGGLFCQWTHTYEISEDDLRSIVHTFASVFPEGTMWLIGEGDLLLIASRSPGIVERTTALVDRARSGLVPAMLADLGVHPGTAPFVLSSFFAGGPADLARFGKGAAVQTDDRMSLEFTAARAMHAPPDGQARRLRQFAAEAPRSAVFAAIVRSAGAEDWTSRGDVALRAGAFAVAHESFRHAASLDSRSPRALRGSSEAAAALGRLADEAEWLKTLATSEPRNAPVRTQLSHTLATLGDAVAAVAIAREAARIDPSSAAPLEQLASIFADVGDVASLTWAADELVSRFPERPDGRYYRAAALFLSERTADAERSVRSLLATDSRHAKGLNLLGMACAARGDRDCARTSFTRSLEVDPRDSSVYVNLGHLSMAGGDKTAAGEFFREAVVVDPANAAAREGLDAASAADRTK